MSARLIYRLLYVVDERPNLAVVQASADGLVFWPDALAEHDCNPARETKQLAFAAQLRPRRGRGPVCAPGFPERSCCRNRTRTPNRCGR